jgi:hypothetical protein
MTFELQPGTRGLLHGRSTVTVTERRSRALGGEKHRETLINI